MRAPLLSLACLICLAQAATSPSVFAQTAGTDPQVVQARARFEEGIKAYDAGRYEQARLAFLQTYALKKDPGVLLNLAFASVKSGHALDGQKYFKQYLADAPSTATKERGAASDGLKEAEGALGRIEVTGPPKGVVLVDGVEVGAAPLAEPVAVDPGEHAITLKTPDGVAQTQRITVHAGEKTTARFKDATGTPPAAATDNKPEGASSTAAPSGGREKEEGTAPPAAPPEATAPPPPKDTSSGPGPFSPPRNVVPAVILGGAALVGYAFAIGFFVSEGQANDNVNKDKAFIIANSPPGTTAVNCSSPPSNFVTACHALVNDQDAANTDTVVAGIGLGVGLAATAGAIIYWVMADKGDAKTGATHLPVVTPIIGVGSGGLSVAGSF
jgi:PEGA domain